MATVRCLCPPTPAGETRHPDGDTITLRPRLDFRGALAARNAIALAKDEGAGTAEILAALTETYLIAGIDSWSLVETVDGKVKPIAPSRDNITAYLLTQDVAMDVADEADELYRDAVIGPLVARASTSSPDTPTPDSTSPTNGSEPSPLKPSKRSSTTTTRTAGTAPTT